MTASRHLLHPCAAAGCTLRVRGEAAYCSEHSGERCGWVELTRRVVRRAS